MHSIELPPGIELGPVTRAIARYNGGGGSRRLVCTPTTRSTVNAGKPWKSNIHPLRDLHRGHLIGVEAHNWLFRDKAIASGGGVMVAILVIAAVEIYLSVKSRTWGQAGYATWMLIVAANVLTVIQPTYALWWHATQRRN